ncbi:MAG: hypothetical protein ACUZ8E_00635 [Candidatus Anammoxibacter sp.]
MNNETNKNTELMKECLSIKNAKWFGRSPDKWLRHVVDIHFNPDSGSEYWLNKELELGIDAKKEITSISKLMILGPMVENDLRNFPLEYFIPKKYLKRKSDFILGETSGTTGKPKVTAYLMEEFLAIFVDYFEYIAKERGFPTGGNWLWVGPSGPHIIGKAVGFVARSMGSMDPFSVDFDPRWAKKLNTGSFAAKRYLKHVIDQAFDILQTQAIDVIFTTPVVLKELALRMDESAKMRIKGIHYGGISIDKEDFRKFKEEDFPNAVHISGYGNTLFGLCLEVDTSKEFNLDYYPPGPRMILQVVSTENGLKPTSDRLTKLVEYGEKGQVLFHRLDESFFIPNMFERDRAIRIAPTDSVKSLGINMDGVRNPSLLNGAAKSVKVGLY